MRPIVGIGLKILSIAIFVMMMAIVKLLAESIPIGQIIFVRGLLGVVPVLIFAYYQNELKSVFRFTAVRTHMKWSLAASVAMFLWFTALVLIPLPEATAIGFAAPLLMIIFASLLLGETIRIFRWMAVLAGLCGVMIIIWPRLGEGISLDQQEALGALAALISASFWALAQIFNRRLTATDSTGSIVVSFSTTISLLALLTIPLGLTNPSFAWVIPDERETLLLILCALTGGIGQILVSQAFRFAEASTVAPFEYTMLLFASIVGILFFSEYPDDNVLLGAPVVIAAGLFVIYREHRLASQSSGKS